jgi:glycosyltransferase involved in cell wall biosynthesis
MKTNIKQVTSPKLTIAVITLNEAERIEQCLRSAAFADELIVVDSGSTDETQSIARRMGAQVFEYTDWQGFGEQRNRLLEHSTGEYIFFLDADETLSSALQSEIETAIATASTDKWKVQWNQVAYGQPLSRMRSTGGVIRMFKRSTLIRWTGVVHEHAITNEYVTGTQRFKARLLHHSRPSVHSSLLKLAQYAQLGAAKRAATGKRGGILRGLASGSVSFLRLYIFQGGILCGPQGFLFCFFIALEGFFRYVALKYDKDLLQQLHKRQRN